MTKTTTMKWISLAALALSIGCKATGCERHTMSNGSLSMTLDDLEKAYRRNGPAFGGRKSARAVVVGAEGISVAVANNPSGEGYHTSLLRLNLDGIEEWERHYDRKYGNAGAILRLANGEFVLAGERERDAMHLQGSLLRIDATGNVIAGQSFGPPSVTSFASVQVRPDGTILAGGSSDWKAWLVTTDPAFRNPGDRSLDMRDVESIRLLSSGDLVVVGPTDRPSVGWARTKVFSVAPDGHVRWQRELPFSASAVGEPAALVARGDGVVVIGNSPEGTWFIHFDRNGEVIWERMFADIDGSIAVGLPDGFAVAGETATQSPQGATTTQHVWRFANDGTLLSDQTWSERNVGGGLHSIREQMFDIDATSDGGIVLAGSTSRGPGKTNIWIVRLAPDGKLLWERIIGKPAPAPSGSQPDHD